jgi:hypothetical protein
MMLRVVVKCVALALMSALVVVPTVLRSRQHVELRDSTRLSIRLNWQGEAPPQKDRLDSHDNLAEVPAPVAVMREPHAPRITPRTHAVAEPVLRPPCDNAPDPLRGPPSFLS